GKLPFDAPTPLAMAILVATETPTPVRTLAPHIPEVLANLITKLMCKNRSGRPQSAAEVKEAIRDLVKELKEKESTPPPAPRAAVAPVPLSVSMPQVLPLAEEFPESAPREPESDSLPQKLSAARESPKPPTPDPAKAKRLRLSWLIAAAVCVLLGVAALG